ncbi:MAG: alpha/beta hydrolase [Victivallaceae bacterium]|nr:alpha/beta hydrolase [Victivallaceae bacterium]
MDTILKRDALAEFNRLVTNGTLKAVLDSQCNCNAESAVDHRQATTWHDIAVNSGWRIQRFGCGHHLRIVDPSGIRQSCGPDELVFRRILHRPVNWFVNIMTVPDTVYKSFYTYLATNNRRNETVVLVHGWVNRAVSMHKMATHLSSCGYDVLVYDYMSSTAGVSAHGRELLLKAAQRFCKLKQNIHFVTHSMGGLLLRVALEQDTKDLISSRIGKVILLAPPNGGSPWADLLTMLGADAFDRAISDLRMAPDGVGRYIGPPAHYKGEITIIGGAFDLKVPKNSLRVDNAQCVVREMLPVGHHGMCSNLLTAQAVERYLLG